MPEGANDCIHVPMTVRQQLLCEAWRRFPQSPPAPSWVTYASLCRSVFNDISPITRVFTSIRGSQEPCLIASHHWEAGTALHIWERSEGF